jgi:hypothetical protein
MGATISFIRANKCYTRKFGLIDFGGDADNQQLAELFCLDGKWQVNMVTIENKVVTISWFDFLQIVYRFSEFVAGGSELIIHQLRNPETETGEEE